MNPMSPNTVPGAPLPPPQSMPAAAAVATPASVPNAVIAVQNVAKFYGPVVAVGDVSVGIGPGVTALLGPNGAGKSTLFRMLCGLTPPSRGHVTVLGADPRTDRDVRGAIGLVPQQDALFDQLTATEFVALAARTQGVAAGSVDEVTAWALREVDLADVGTKAVGSFSKGMRQRVKVAAALVHRPAVLILDEPLTGLDPVQRRRMIALFHRLGEEGCCVVVSSHVLDEVARLGSNVIVIAQGRLIAQGDYRDLRGLMDDRPHRIRLATSDPQRLGGELVGGGVVSAVTVERDHLVVETRDVDTLGRQIAPIAQRLGARLSEVRPLDDDLESVFRYLVERR